MAQLLTPDRADAGPLSRRSGSDERGITMVVTMIILFVVFALGAVWLGYADHAGSSAAHDRRRQQAVDAANAGLVVADAALARNSAYPGVDVTGFPGGSAEFDVDVQVDPTDPTGFRRIVTATGYAPTKATATSTRTVRQLVELDPVGFQYAMMSENAITTGSASAIVGDIYANGSVTLGNSQDYVGNVYVQGNLTTGSNQNITGDVYATGNVTVGSTSTAVKGSVYAGGSLTTGGTIYNDAVVAGTISNCAKVKGTCSPHTPPPPVAMQHLPRFTWNPANYATVQTPTSGSQFVNTVSRKNASGVYYINGDVTFANNDDLYLVGDMTIVATGAIALPRQVQNRTPDGSTVQLSIISTNGGTITPSNNFTIPGTIRTLMYTTGLFDTKNSSAFSGSLYAGSLTNGAHVNVSYQPLDDTGFDWTLANPQSFTIRNISTREIAPGT
jgi:hypothetical protein